MTHEASFLSAKNTAESAYMGTLYQTPPPFVTSYSSEYVSGWIGIFVMVIKAFESSQARLVKDGAKSIAVAPSVYVLSVTSVPTANFNGDKPLQSFTISLTGLILITNVLVVPAAALTTPPFEVTVLYVSLNVISLSAVSSPNASEEGLSTIVV